MFGQGLYSTTETTTTQQGGAITSGWDVFVPYGTGVYTGSANPDTAYGGYGNPSSVILNGHDRYQRFGPMSTPTPGDLTDNPTNPAFTQALWLAVHLRQQSTLGGCTNNQVIGQFLPANIQTLLNSPHQPERPRRARTMASRRTAR